MSKIHLTTFIAAPKQRVFDLSRSVELHRASMNKHQETITDGVMAGLMKLDDTVTWKARHLRKERILKMKITAFQRPDTFTDEQVQGDFTTLKHEHFFRQIENGTLMIDIFSYELPRGVLGKWLNSLFLEKYLTNLLNERNAFIKEVAETSRWRQYIQE
jgi:ligand-binding SRPBCC domain-containing protein